jgi:hypothetical protein
MITILQCIAGGGDSEYLRVVLYHKSVIQEDLWEREWLIDRFEGLGPG